MADNSEKPKNQQPVFHSNSDRVSSLETRMKVVSDQIYHHLSNYDYRWLICKLDHSKLSEIKKQFQVDCLSPSLQQFCNIVIRAFNKQNPVSNLCIALAAASLYRNILKESFPARQHKTNLPDAEETMLYHSDMLNAFAGVSSSMKVLTSELKQEMYGKRTKQSTGEKKVGGQPKQPVFTYMMLIGFLYTVDCV